MLVESVLHHAVLPLTSTCNVACVFCSNRQNPPGVKTYDIPPRALDDVLQHISLLRSHQKVVIGESATRINEGEPYTYPHLNLVLSKIREKMPAARIALTTNGTLVSAADVELLRELGDVHVTLSLNSVSADVRERIMKDREPKRACRTLVMLAEHGIGFSGSIVAVPEVSGWEDISATIRALASYGARTVRLFVPGYTKCGSPLISEQDESKLLGWAREQQARYGVPVSVEPRMLSRVRTPVEAVIKQSAAARAGILAGDDICCVDGVQMITSQDAFYAARDNASPELDLIRGGQRLKVRLAKPQAADTGLVMRLDMSGRRLQRLQSVLRSCGTRSAIVTSELAAHFFEDALAELPRDAIRVFSARNSFFGGNIQSAGLLTVQDFRDLFRTPAFVKWNPQLVILPVEPFNRDGDDLLGVCRDVLKEEFAFDLQFM